jgi:thiamine biosynthesis lipoprotein ApbE
VAMLADALATAAFVLGPREGIRLLNRKGVEGVIFTSDLPNANLPNANLPNANLRRHETRGLCRAA